IFGALFPLASVKVVGRPCFWHSFRRRSSKTPPAIDRGRVLVPLAQEILGHLQEVGEEVGVDEFLERLEAVRCVVSPQGLQNSSEPPYGGGLVPALLWD